MGGEELVLARDGEEEEESVRGPGEAPGDQHHETSSPQLPLRLRKREYFYFECLKIFSSIIIQSLQYYILKN